MSKQVDSRVVEMRFDNKQFEKETKTTLGTLEKLKQALQFKDASKGLDGLSKSVNNVKVDPLLASVQALEKRFSTFGIVGMQIIQNLTNSLTGKFISAIHLVTSAIDEGGKRRAFNIENAHFQLQALLGDEEKVQAIMDDANASVTDTAYGFDEAAKAASAFAATGIEAGENMQRALKGIAGVAAMTNSQYSDISMIFTTVAGQGRLMGDQLLQLASRGLNAASTLKDFFNDVNSGSKQASESVDSAIFALTKGLPVSETQIRDFVSEGKISFAIFSEAMGQAFGDSAKRANETFNGAMSNMKAALGRIGAEFYSPLIKQNSEVVLLINSVKTRINDLKKALTFSEEIGNVNALSKQWTDFVLNSAKNLRNWVENVDLKRPIAIFYNLVESVKNSANGLFQVIGPIGKALKEVFIGDSPALKMGMLENFSIQLRNFTANLKVSDKDSKNLQKTFKGLFSVGKLLLDIFLKLVSALNPFGKPLASASEGVLSLTGSIGDLLTRFTEWVRKSPSFNKSFEILGKGVQLLIKGISGLVNGIVYLAKSFADLPIAKKAFEYVKEFLKFLDQKIATNVEKVTTNLKHFSDQMKVAMPKGLEKAYDAIGDSIKGLSKIFENVNFTTPKQAIESLRDALSDLLKALSSSDGVNNYISNLVTYLNRLKEAFTLDNLIKNIEDFRSVIGGFLGWIHDFVTPIFEELNAGTFIAGGTGVGIVYALVKMSDAFDKISGAISKFKSIPEFFGTMKGVMDAYQKDLNANALLKVAGAIGILGGALVLMSFADPNGLMTAGLALSMVAGVLLAGMTKLTAAIKKTKTVTDYLDTFADGLTKSLNNLAKAVKWKAIGKAFKSFAIGIGVIAASVIALAYMYSKDANAVNNAVEIMKQIGFALAAVVAIFSGLGEVANKGVTSIKDLGTGVLMITAGLFIVVSALEKLFDLKLPESGELNTKLFIVIGILGLLGTIALALNKFGGEKVSGAKEIIALTAMLYVTVLSLEKLFKIKFPDDWENRLWILAGIFGGLALVAIAIGKSTKDAGGGKLKAAGSILALTVMLWTTVKSLEKLMTMPMPEDWIARLGILAAIFLALGFVITMLGNAAGNGGSIKAAGTILALCLMIGTIVAALMVLQMIPGPQLLKGAIALGGVLIAVGAALKGASQSTDKESAKTVLAMAVMIGSIVAALSILSLIPLPQLAKAAGVLGAMLIALAQNFKQASKMSNKSTWQSILAMAAITVAIATELYVLSDQPWEGLLAAATALSETLLTISGCFYIISKAKIDLGQVGKFLLASVSLIGIVAGIVILANYPWQGLLAAGTAMSEVLLAFSAAFFIISKSNPDVMAMGAFLVASASLLLVAASIAILADYDWQGLLAAGTAITMVLESMTKTMTVCAFVGNAAGPAITGLGVLDIFIADLAAVFAALGWLFQGEYAQGLLNGGIDVLIKIADGIGSFIDTIIMGTIEKMSKRLPDIGDNLSEFMDNLEGFIAGARTIDSEVVTGINGLASMMGTLTKTSFIDGIASFFNLGTSSLTDFGSQLEEFGPYVARFGKSIRGINPEQVNAASNLSQIISVVMQKLPRQNEMVDKIFGEKKTLKEFGEELEKFGPSIRVFAKCTKDINAESVQGAASAVKILADMADTLPNSGGWMGTIFGDNDLDDFGKQLGILAPCLVLFATTTKDIDEQSVTGAVNAVKLLAEMADTIPNTGGLWADIWGDNTLDEFGSALEALGKSLANFSTSVTDLNLLAISGACNQLTTLVGIFKQTDDFDSIAMVNFIAALGEMADMGLDAFVNAFKDSGDKVVTAINMMLGYVEAALADGRDSLVGRGQSVGKDLSTAISDGFSWNKAALLLVVTGMMNSVIDSTKTALDPKKFSAMGNDAMVSLRQGIAQNNRPASLSCSTLANNMIKAFTSVLTYSRMRSISQTAMDGLSAGLNGNTAVRSASRAASDILHAFSRNFSWEDMYWLGSQSALGLAYGIESRIYDIAQASIRAARTALNYAAKVLRVASPSKETFWIGEMFDEGLAGGILYLLETIGKAAARAGETAIDEVQNPLSQISDVASSMFTDIVDPTITPRVDFSLMRKDCDEMIQMMNGAISNTESRAQGIAGNVMGTAQRQEQITGYISERLSDLSRSLSRPNGATYQNTFEIHGEDPEEIASEVSQILQRQVERKEAVWA